MNLERYPTFTNDYHDYEFYSEGPKGRIKKVIMFAKAQNDPLIYNLAFGDIDPKTGILRDDVRTNNKDSDKVLATVASTIHTFCNNYGNHYIYAEGRTPARTRLYQMNISRLWEEINEDFELYGLKNGVFRDFQKHVNYDGFLVKRKLTSKFDT